ncbi:SulP family inorganic anion transporter, partial [uncultured Aurantimicrobium sp.]|uniref:SulP family inorganic anion transporter n=1 Tax=uncultured Aurantimicrobium sp. TaxID=1705357 RepID=UPI00260FC88E
ELFYKDLMSGVIVGIVALPLAIAFGIASGVTPEKGLYTAIIAGFLISFLGGSKVQIGGPTGAFIVIVYGIVQEFGVAGLAIATMIAGVMLIAMGLLKLGSVIKFIPYPVVVGFTSGIALTIFTTQIKDLFGLETGALPGDFIHKWITYGNFIGTINYWSLGVGVASILIISLTPKISKKIPGSLIAIVLMTVVVYFLREKLGVQGIETIGDRFTIDPSLPKAATPEISFSVIQTLLPTAFTIAMLGAIESLLSARVAASMANTGVFNPDRELVGQGLASVGSALFGGMPATGAIARTAVNVRSGGKTRMASIVHAVVLLGVVYLATGPVSRIPLAALAGVLMVTAVRMVPSKAAWKILRSTKHDATIFIATAVITVALDLIEAVVVGIVVTVLFSIRALIMRGKVHQVELPGPAASGDERIALFRIDGALYFGVADKIHEEVTTHPDVTVVVIQLSGVQFLDATGAQILAEIVMQLERDGKTAIIKGIPEQHRELITRVGVLGQLRHPNHLFDNLELAVAHARSHITREDAATAEGLPRPFFS